MSGDDVMAEVIWQPYWIFLLVWYGTESCGQILGLSAATCSYIMENLGLPAASCSYLIDIDIDSGHSKHYNIHCIFDFYPPRYTYW